ncbi:MAG: Hsp20/alpha crystallin family protein [Saprospiraceae bacterium]|nr:Hsp20/alpha crystallin family protein [Saprospiraceae bacterium]
MTILQVRPAVRKHPVVDFNAFDQLLRTMAQVNLPASNGDVSNRPAVNVKETGEAFFIELAAPGLDKQDFEVKLDKNVLHIAAKKKYKP